MAALLTAVVVTGVVTTAGSPARATQTIGYPTFTGPALPAEPVHYTASDMMKAIYDQEKGGTDFWMDRLLARPGADPAGNWLVTRDHTVYMRQRA